MILKPITPPAEEPIALSDVERQCRIGSLESESAEVNLFISACRQRAEAITRRALITQTWELVLDGFPQNRNAIILPKPPLQSVTSITYVDQNGVTQTLDPLAYRVIEEAVPAYIVPVYGTIWPSTLSDVATVRVRFVCGYGPAEGSGNNNVPEAIKQWLTINVANLYESRESLTVAAGRLTEIDLSPFADSLLDDFRVRGF